MFPSFADMPEVQNTFFGEEVTKIMARHVVGPVKEIPPGTSKIVTVGRRSIGVFNIKGEFFAIRNTCPHQFAPLCLGEVTGMVTSTGPGEMSYSRDGEIIRCPWHGWEFDIKTGRSIFNPHRVRVKSYEVSVEGAGPPLASNCAGHTSSEQFDTPDEDPSVETYEVTVEEEIVILHV